MKHIKYLICIFVVIATVASIGVILAGCIDTDPNFSEFEVSPLKAEPVAATTQMVPNIIDSYKGEDKNYYLLDGGYIKNTYISTLASVNYTGVPVEFSKTTTTATEILNSVTETIDSSYTVIKSTDNKGEIGLSEAYPIPIKLGVEWTISSETSTNNTKSTSDTVTSANTYSESQTISYAFGSNEADSGWYRYALYATLDVYYVCVTNSDNSELISIEANVCARENDYFVRSEYSANGDFDNTPESNVVFAEDFFKQLPLPTTITPSELLPQTYYLQCNKYNCQLDNGYDISKPTVNDDRAIYGINSDVCEIVLNGTVKKNDAYSIINGNSGLEIGLKMLQPYDWIELTDFPGHTYQSAKISNDGMNKVSGTSINKAVGHGAVYIIVSYSDGTAASAFATDIMNGKTTGEYIDILEVTDININAAKSISEISIHIAYEIEGFWKGALGVFWYSTFTNWHCINTLEFI